MRRTALAAVAVFLVGVAAPGTGLHHHPQAGKAGLGFNALLGSEGHALVGRGFALRG